MELNICAVCARKNAPQYLTVDDVAEVLCVSKMTVYRLIEKGLLKAARIGRQIRIKSADFDDYVRHVAA